MKETANFNLADTALDSLEKIHIDAKGIVEGKLENIGIDFSHLDNAKINFTYWDTMNPMTGKVRRRKEVTINFTGYEMNYKLQDDNKQNILKCLWEASKK